MTKDKLLWFFDYDRESGVLVWKNHWHKETATRVVGTIAGTRDSHGYRVVRLYGRGHKVHRIIWFLETGKWTKQIDHKDGKIRCLGTFPTEFAAHRRYLKELKNV